MPIGTRHELTGLLVADGRGGLLLRMDDGGEWRLDVSGRAARHLGRRVRVSGTKDGFDLLAVARLSPT